MKQPQLTIDLGKPFDRIAFVEEKETVEILISVGWMPIWEPNMTLNHADKKVPYPNFSDYYILVG